MKTKIQKIVLFFFGFLFFVYGVLGFKFYNKTTPFFDSFSFQKQYVDIIKNFDQVGYINNLNKIFDHSNTYFFRIVTILFSPILPRSSVVGLYMILFPVYIYLLFFIFKSFFYLSKSYLKSLIGLIFLLNINIFNDIYFSPINQRLDLLAGLLVVSYFLSSFLVVKKKKVDFNFIIITIILLLHRPLYIIFIFITWTFNLIFNYKDLFLLLNNKKFIKVNLILYFFIFIFYLINKNLNFIIDYYYIYNIDVGKNSSITKSFNILINELINSHIGLNLFLIILIFFLIFFIKVKLNDIIKFFVVNLLFLSPYVISKSANNPYTMMTISLIFIVSFFIFLFYKVNLKKRDLIFLLIPLIIYFIFNKYSLYLKIKNYYNPDLITLKKVLSFLKNESKNNKNKIFISGIGPIGSYLYGLSHLNYETKFIYGKYFNHATDFKINKFLQFQYHKKNVLDNLRSICDYKGYLISLNDKNQNNINHYLYVLRFVKEINKELKRVKCLKKLDYDFIAENNYYSIYEIE